MFSPEHQIFIGDVRCLFQADVSCKNNYCLLIKHINTSVLKFVFLVSLFEITERIE